MVSRFLSSRLGFMFELLFLLGIFVSLVDSQFTSSRNFWPASYPLAVRSPYLNTWMDSINNVTTSLNFWPYHWDDSNIMGWSGFIRIDGVAWQWMGEGGPGNGTTLRNSEVTPTSTKFQVVAGPMLLNLTFLSPIEPSDWVRQSLPFIYLSLEATSLDGQSHDVQVYSDISAEWISGNRNNIATWSTKQTSSSVYHQAQLQTPQNMTEINNIAEDSTVYYSMKMVPSMTWQSEEAGALRGQFGSTGQLSDQQDTNFRAINDNGNFVVFGIAVDLGTIQSTSSPVVWGLGLVRDPVTVVTKADGTQQNRRSYFWSNYTTISDAIDAFLADYPNAVQRAAALDQQIMNDASSISDNYVDLLSLGARQAMAIADITLAQGSDGNLNISDVQVFMRDVGVGQSANPVITIFEAFPVYMYLNASLGGMLLKPLLEYQSSSQYKNGYAAPDLGSAFPKALGDSSDTHTEGLEHTGDMLIMAYAHARFSGDGSLIKQYYTLLKSWADYLVANSLYTSGQTSADGLSNGNITNLAIKGIIGIGAMAGISEAVGEGDDARQYSVNASTLAKQWVSLASSSGHLLGTYDGTDASALMYNLYADRLLQTGLVDQSVYTQQTSFYSNESQSAAQFGLPYDSTVTTQANSVWTLFTAATTTDNTTRNQLIDMVHARAGFNRTKGDFPTLYNPSTGNSSAANGQASPGQGGMFALLALNVNNKTITFPASAPQTSTGSGSSSSSHTNAGVIAGAVIGSVVGVGLLAAVGFFFWRRRHRQEQERWRDEMAPVPFDRERLSRPRSAAVLEATPFASPAPEGNTLVFTPLRGGGDGGGGKRRLPPQPDAGQQSRWEESTQSSNPGGLSSPTQSQALTTSTGTGSRSDASQLRTDVENLRREMEQLRMEREYEMLAPPPQYGS